MVFYCRGHGTDHDWIPFLGEKFTLPLLREHGKLVLWISVAEVVVTALAVLIGLLLIGLPMDMALLLAGIATATDPAAITDVVHETHADGVFTRAMLGIVAVDDAWGLIVFSLMLTIAQAFSGQGGTIGPCLLGPGNSAVPSLWVLS
jgi:NhaP-type Na+/H+ or K+/H+ antiporter